MMLKLLGACEEVEAGFQRVGSDHFNTDNSRSKAQTLSKPEDGLRRCDSVAASSQLFGIDAY
jgi:hypothetical protein